MGIKKRPEKEALITLYTDEGLTDGQIARRLKVDRTTVYRWKRHYGIEIAYRQVFQARVKRGGE